MPLHPGTAAVLAAVYLASAAAATAGTFKARVRSGSWDVEERSSGLISLSSGNLEMVTSGGNDQTVGIRWEALGVPRGATITRAYVQFTAAKSSSKPTALLVRGHAARNARPFSSVRRDVSSRPRTAAAVAWSPLPSWTRNAAGPEQRVDVTPIVREIVGRPNWASGNAIAFIITGSGHRAAWSYEGARAKAPLLRVDYTTAPDTTPPTVALTSPPDGAKLAGVNTLAAQAADNIGVTSVTFQQDSVTLGTDATAPYTYAWDTTKVGNNSYTLTAVASDAAGNRTVSRLVVVTVGNAGAPPPPPPPPSSTLIVPDQFATVQAAIDAAGDGDTVLVRPGTYAGGLVIAGKRITLESEYRRTGDAGLIDRTVLTGGSPVVSIASSAVGVIVDGLTLKSGGKQVQASGDRVVVRNNRFVDSGSDAMSFERTGGTVSGNTFLNTHDDCIDADGPLDVLIENNVCIGPSDDGIEVRNFTYTGDPTLTFVIRNNTIVSAHEDGIQIIDYPATSNRVFRLERNEIRNNADVGLGIMGDGNTVEDYSGYSMPERVYVLNNTFEGNKYGITGGDNLIALNNIFTSAGALALKNVDGGSVVQYSLFHGNVAKLQSANVIATNDVDADPLYVDQANGNLRLRSGSPAIDAGTASYTHLSQPVLAYPPGSYAGPAPDLGAYETVSPP